MLEPRGVTKPREKELNRCIVECFEKTGEEIVPDIKATLLHHTIDNDTSKFMAAKDINTTKYADIKRYIETRYLAELGRRTGAKNGAVSALEEGEQVQWYSEGDANDLSTLKGGKKGWAKARALARGPNATGATGTAT